MRPFRRMFPGCFLLAATLIASAFAACRPYEETPQTAPLLNISQPAEGALFSEGDTIPFRVVCAQAEGGPLLAGLQADYSPPGSEEWTSHRFFGELAAGEFLYIDTLAAPADSGQARWRFSLWNETGDTVRAERAYALEPATP